MVRVKPALSDCVQRAANISASVAHLGVHNAARFGAPRELHDAVGVAMDDYTDELAAIEAADKAARLWCAKNQRFGVYYCEEDYTDEELDEICGVDDAVKEGLESCDRWLMHIAQHCEAATRCEAVPRKRNNIFCALMEPIAPKAEDNDFPCADYECGRYAAECARECHLKEQVEAKRAAQREAERLGLEREARIMMIAEMEARRRAAAARRRDDAALPHITRHTRGAWSSLLYEP